MAHALYDAGDPLRCQRQSVQHGRAHPRLFRSGHVFSVGGKPTVLLLSQSVRNGSQRCVFSGRTGGGEHIGGILGRLPLLL